MKRPNSGSQGPSYSDLGREGEGGSEIVAPRCYLSQEDHSEFYLGVGKRRRGGDSQHGIGKQRHRRLGSTTGAPNQPRGSHLPCQGLGFLIGKTVKWDKELFESPSSNHTLGFYRRGKEEAEQGKEGRSEEQVFLALKKRVCHRCSDPLWASPPSLPSSPVQSWLEHPEPGAPEARLLRSRRGGWG